MALTRTTTVDRDRNRNASVKNHRNSSGSTVKMTSTNGVSHSPVVGEKKVAKKSSPSKRLDFRGHYERATFIVSFFVVVVAFVRYLTLEARNYGPASGPKFHQEFSPFLTENVILMSTLGYPICVMLLCRFMKNRSSLDGKLMRSIQAIYNCTQIGVCMYMVYGLAEVVYNPIMGLNSKLSAKIEYFVFIHYLTKYLDWCDTFFMITKKKFSQVSFLHIFHHATIGAMWAIMLNEGVGSGTTGFGAFMNSLTHVIMYTHYLVTSFGIRNPFKRYITRWQLFQFATCLSHSVIVLFVENVIPKQFALLQTMYQTLMLALFGLYMNWVPTWLTGYDPTIATKPKAS